MCRPPQEVLTGKGFHLVDVMTGDLRVGNHCGAREQAIVNGAMPRSLSLALMFAAPLALIAAVLVLNRAVDNATGGYDYVVRIALPSADAPLDLPRVDGPRDASRPLVVIDAGHGGFDPGAGQGAIKEKTVALGIALALRERLLKAGGIRVAMTREDDRFVPLADRPTIARRLNADLFVSIHADSAENNAARGASVYILSDKGSSEAAARFAARENGADIVNGVQLSGTTDAVNAILLDLSQREAQAGSTDAAGLLLRELDGKVLLHRGRVESAALAVLKAPDIPSILFETGYINNPEDEKLLTSREGRRTLSEAAATAIRVFFARKAGV